MFKLVGEDLGLVILGDAPDSLNVINEILIMCVGHGDVRIVGIEFSLTHTAITV